MPPGGSERADQPDVCELAVCCPSIPDTWGTCHRFAVIEILPQNATSRLIVRQPRRFGAGLNYARTPGMMICPAQVFCQGTQDPA